MIEVSEPGIASAWTGMSERHSRSHGQLTEAFLLRTLLDSSVIRCGTAWLVRLGRVCFVSSRLETATICFFGDTSER